MGLNEYIVRRNDPVARLGILQLYMHRSMLIEVGGSASIIHMFEVLGLIVRFITQCF